MIEKGDLVNWIDRESIMLVVDIDSEHAAMVEMNESGFEPKIGHASFKALDIVIKRFHLLDDHARRVLLACQ